MMPEPGVTYRRPWTLDQRRPTSSGTWRTHATVKRICNGCGNAIGDVNAADLDAAISGRPLPDVTGECPFCAPQGR